MMRHERRSAGTAVVQDSGTVKEGTREDGEIRRDSRFILTTIPSFRAAILLLLLVASLLVGILPARAQTSGDALYDWYMDMMGDEQRHLTPVPVPSGIIALTAYSSYALKFDGTVWMLGTHERLPVLGGITAITDAAMVLKGDGTVWSWGNNVGDGTSFTYVAPVAVPGLTNVMAIASYGGDAKYVLKSDRTVWAWGYRYLGDGPYRDSSAAQLTPVRVPGLTDVTAICTAYNRTYVIKSDNTVWAWGMGYLGDGPYRDSSAAQLTPVQISALCGIGVRAIFPYGNRSFAIKSNGAVLAWGQGLYGALGTGDELDRLTPVPVLQADGMPLTNAIGISSKWGDVTFSALKGDGTVWAWGWEAGTITDMPKGHLNKATKVSYLSDITAISYQHLLRREAVPIMTEVNQVFVPEGGAVGFRVRLGAAPVASVTVNATRASGDSDIAVQTGASLTFTPANWDNWQTVTLAAAEDADTADGVAEIALAVPGFPTGTVVRAIETDNDNATPRAIWAWGYNGSGQLGDGSTTDRHAPVLCGMNSGASNVAAGLRHSVALSFDGMVWTWGDNSEGQLGDGSKTGRELPAPVSGISNVTAIAAGAYRTMALKSDRTLWVWGGDGPGSQGEEKLTPAMVAGLANVTAVAGGERHMVALKGDGTVWVWGSNQFGQLGDGGGTYDSHQWPTQVPEISGVTALAAGVYHTLVVKSDGTVWGWGDNSSGQLGDGTTMQRRTPVQVSGLTGVVAVAAGVAVGGGMTISHSLALKADGSVWAWGDNTEGALGDGTTASRLTPVRVTGLTDVAGVAAASHSMARKANGTLWAWGSAYFGQLGDGTTTMRLTPTQVPGLINVVGFAAGQDYSLATTVVDAGDNRAPAIVSAAWANPNPLTLPAATTVQVVAADPDGDTVSYAWSQVSGAGTATFGAPSAADSGVTFSAAGTYLLLVTVEDGKGGNVSSEVSVTVNDLNSVDRRADINADGVVNALDLQIVIANFGKTVP